jgi:hypothetical protein
MKRLPHDSLAQAGFFQKKEPVPQICKPVPVPLFYSWNLSGRHRETIVARRPVVPEEAVRVCMIQPEDIAVCVLLAVQLPC